MLRNKRGKSGQAYVETLLVLPLLLFIAAGVVWFGQVIYTKLALEGAAWSGARHAVATLDPQRGSSQAFLATRYGLDGFGLNPESAQASMTVWGRWGRGTQVRSTVCYNVPPPPVPFGDMFAGRRICAQQTMAVYRWKSDW
jgi:Flp pilus assembly protein TadG